MTFSIMRYYLTIISNLTLSLITFSITILSIMTISITIHSIMTISIMMILSIMTISIMILSIMKSSKTIVRQYNILTLSIMALTTSYWELLYWVSFILRVIYVVSQKSPLCWLALCWALWRRSDACVIIFCKIWMLSVNRNLKYQIYELIPDKAHLLKWLSILNIKTQNWIVLPLKTFSGQCVPHPHV